MNDLSIIIPCFNEEKNLIDIIDQLEIIKKNNIDINFEFILVNNGSTDQTSETLIKLNKNNICKIIDLKNNLGYGGGILEGVRSASGTIISWTHGDLQCDPYDIVKGYKLNKEKLLSNKCIVKGKRIKRKIMNTFFSNSMSIIASIIFGQKFFEINAQPKIFHRELINYFNDAPKDFSLDLFLLYISKKKFYEVIEQPVIYKKRIAGVAKGGDSFIGKIKLTIRTIKYIINFRIKSYGNNNSQN